MYNGSQLSTLIRQTGHTVVGNCAGIMHAAPEPHPAVGCAVCLSVQVLRVPLEEFKSLMVSGDMLLPSITTAYLAIDKLREQGLL